MVGEAIQRQVKTEYHCFMHHPDEVKEDLRTLGVAKERLQSEDTLRILDTYSATTGLGGSKPLEKIAVSYEAESIRLREWAERMADTIKRGPSEEEQEWLHIDDNTSVLLQYNTENEILDHWRIRAIPYARARKLAMVHSLVTGVASTSFYRKFESICDGIIDFRTSEESGRMNSYVRARRTRGSLNDSQWRRIRLGANSWVTVESDPTGQLPELGSVEEAKAATLGSPIMKYLVEAFNDDYMRKRLSLEQAGWRGMMDIVTSTRIPKSQAYGDERYGHAFGRPLEALIRARVVEYRYFRGKGRGGNVTRLRACYEREPVKRAVDQLVWSKSTTKNMDST